MPLAGHVTDPVEGEVLEPVAYTQGSAIALVGANVVAVDYGFVNLNFDKAAFAKKF